MEKKKLNNDIALINHKYLPTILPLDASFGFAHVERGVIHPKVKRKVSGYAPTSHRRLSDSEFHRVCHKKKATLTPRILRAP